MAGSGRRVTVPRYCLGKEVNAARVCHNGDQGGRGRPAGGPKRNENCQITFNGILPTVREIPE